jgi:transmembrane sensor
VSPVAGSASQPQTNDLIDANGKAVEEAFVSASNAGETGEPLQLDAGQKATVTNTGKVVLPEPADIERATDWTRRRMVFDSDTLETVVAEFNRYNRKELVIADANLKMRLISGVFNIDDPEAFLTLLKNLDEIHVEESADGSRVIRRTGIDTRS